MQKIIICITLNLVLMKLPLSRPYLILKVGPTDFCSLPLGMLGQVIFEISYNERYYKDIFSNIIFFILLLKIKCKYINT